MARHRSYGSLACSQDVYDRFAAAVELPLTILALLWLPVLVVPYIVNLPPNVKETFAVIDYLVWAAFVLEYMAKLYMSPSRKSFVRHHLIDLLVITLPMLRPLRAARLLRLLNLARVGIVLTNALRRTKSLFTHRGFQYVVLAAMAIVFACSGLVLSFEAHAKGSNIHSFGDAIWWAVVTVTTVGYGDKYPVTAGGRGVAFVLLFVGIGFVGVLTATFASYFVQQNADVRKTELVERLDRFEAMLAEIAGTASEVELHPETVDGDVDSVAQVLPLGASGLGVGKGDGTEETHQREKPDPTHTADLPQRRRTRPAAASPGR